MKRNTVCLNPISCVAPEPVLRYFDLLRTIRLEIESVIERIAEHPEDSPAAILNAPCGLAESVACLLASPGADSFPLSSLMKKHHLTGLETLVMSVLFISELHPGFRTRFSSDPSRSAGPEDTCRLSFAAIIETLGLELSYDVEILNGVIGANSTLVSNRLIEVMYSFEKDDPLSEPDIAIKRDVYALIRGSNSNHDELLSIEYPTTRLEQVVLPEPTKRKLLNLIENFDEIRERRAAMALDDTIEYGQAAVILFHGPSGTGKTMLARAISNYTGKPLVIPRIGDSGIRRYFRSDEFNDVIGRVFFETERHSGILFLDECEEYLNEHSDAMHAFLRMFEQSRCIVILSSNAPESIYASFDRRISLKIAFESPDAWQRLEIWKNLLPPNLRVAPDVDLKVLAQMYPMTGGYIKNALLYAINIAIHRNSKEICLTWADLEEACNAQETHLGLASVWRKLVKTRRCLDSIYLSGDDIGKARRITGRILEIQKVIQRFEGDDTSSLQGPKVLVQAGSGERGRQIAMAIAGEVSEVACVIEVSEILSNPQLVNDPIAAAKVLDGVITTNSASGKIIVILEAEMLFGDVEIDGSKTARDLFRDVLVAHRASVLFVAESWFGLSKRQSHVFFEVFRESADNSGSRLRLWRDIISEFGREWDEAGVGEVLAGFAVDPGDIRRIVLRAIWQEHGESGERVLRAETLIRLAKQHQQSRKCNGFDMVSEG